MTKSGKRREVKIPEVLTEILCKLESKRQNGLVFLNRDGQPYRDVRSANTAALGRSGIKKEIVFHSLRHTFGTLLSKQCRDLNLVKEALGHSSIAVTERYAHVIEDDYRAAIEDLAKDLRHSHVIVADFGGRDKASQSTKKRLVNSKTPT